MAATIQKITPCWWFDDQAEAAVNFYTAIFRNSKIVSTTHYSEEAATAAGRPIGSVMTVAFQLEGQDFLALNGGPQFIQRGHFVHRQLQFAGGGGSLLGQPVTRGR